MIDSSSFILYSKSVSGTVLYFVMCVYCSIGIIHNTEQREIRMANHDLKMSQSFIERDAAIVLRRSFMMKTFHR